PEPLLTARTQLLSRQPFQLSAKNGRRRLFPVRVPALSPLAEWQLLIIVNNMGDDSGDTGMYCALFDANGQRLFRKFGHVEVDRFQHPVTSNSNWTVAIDDQDTTGSGNGGSVEIWV